jgi:hypothetical protein
VDVARLTCQEQDVPERVDDPATLSRVAVLLDAAELDQLDEARRASATAA